MSTNSKYILLELGLGAESNQTKIDICTNDNVECSRESGSATCSCIATAHYEIHGTCTGNEYTFKRDKIFPKIHSTF